MCGEKTQLVKTSSGISGTSPRVWGKEISNRLQARSRRNIPTCVGKSIVKFVVNYPATEHPHVCGEKKASLPLDMRPAGTSPRVWGKEEKLISNGWIDRNIPTCVGKREKPKNGIVKITEHPHVCGEKSSISRDLTACEEHPHVCGEKNCAFYGCSSLAGTSPRVWGKGFFIVKLYSIVRNIPTCVGKS